MITEKIKRLDISNEQGYIHLKCKQYDQNSRKWRLILTDENMPIHLNGNEFITANMIRPNGSYADTICTWENGSLYLLFTEGMLAIPGEADLEITIWDENRIEIIRTMTFHCNIEKSMLLQDRIMRSDEYNVLQHLIQQALRVPDVLQESEEKLNYIKELIVVIETEIEDYREFIEADKELYRLMSELKLALENAEALRVSNENIRISNEDSRIESENIRQDNEEARETAKGLMIEATADCIEKTNQLIEHSNSVIQAMNTATNTAIQSIEEVKEATIEATNQSLEQTEISITATENCVIATENANTATQAARDIVDYAEETIETVLTTAATEAQRSALEAKEYSKISKSHSVGGEVEGDEIANSKYFMEQAKLAKRDAEIAKDSAAAIVGIDVATDERIGLVKGSDDIHIESDGSMTITKKSHMSGKGIVIGTTQSGHTNKDVDYLCSGTNDQDIINSAILELKSNDTLMFLDGTYHLTESINFLEKENIVVKAISQNTVIKKEYNLPPNFEEIEYPPFIKIEASSNIQFYDLHIECNNIDFPDSYGEKGGCFANIVHIDKCSDIIFDSVLLSNSFGTMLLNDSKNISITNCLLLDIQMGISATSCENVDINHCSIKSLKDYQSMVGYLNQIPYMFILDSCKHTNISSNIITCFGVMQSQNCEHTKIKKNRIKIIDCPESKGIVNFIKLLYSQQELTICNNDILIEERSSTYWYFISLNLEYSYYADSIKICENNINYTSPNPRATFLYANTFSSRISLKNILISKNTVVGVTEGITLTYAEGVIISNNSISGKGLRLNNCNLALIEGNQFNSEKETVIYFDRLTNSKIKDNMLSNKGNSCSVYGSGTCKNIDISHNTELTDVSDGIELNSGSGIFENFIFTNNIVNSLRLRAQNGFSLNGKSIGSVTNNVINEGDFEVLNFDGGIVSGNTIKHNKTLSINKSKIASVHGCNLSITDNQVFISDLGLNNIVFGLSVYGYNLKVHSNTLNNCVSGIKIEYGSQYVQVKNNTIINKEEYSSVSDNGSDSIIEQNLKIIK